MASKLFKIAMKVARKMKETKARKVQEAKAASPSKKVKSFKEKGGSPKSKGKDHKEKDKKESGLKKDETEAGGSKKKRGADLTAENLRKLGSDEDMSVKEKLNFMSDCLSKQPGHPDNEQAVTALLKAMPSGQQQLLWKTFEGVRKQEGTDKEFGQASAGHGAHAKKRKFLTAFLEGCLLYTSPSPRD